MAKEGGYAKGLSDEDLGRMTPWLETRGARRDAVIMAIAAYLAQLGESPAKIRRIVESCLSNKSQIGYWAAEAASEDVAKVIGRVKCIDCAHRETTGKCSQARAGRIPGVPRNYRPDDDKPRNCPAFRRARNAS